MTRTKANAASAAVADRADTIRIAGNTGIDAELIPEEEQRQDESSADEPTVADELAATD